MKHKLLKIFWMGSDKYFLNKDQLLDFLLTHPGNNHTNVYNYEYDLDDTYEAVKDIGYPFEYWKKGVSFTLKEWIKQARKMCSHDTENKKDFEIIGSILSKDYFWKKV